MKHPILYSLLSFLIIGLFLFSCDVTDSDEGVRISGTVVDENTGNPLAGALVEITIPQNLEQNTTSDEDGRFVFDPLDLEEETQITIQVSRDGFNNGFAQVTAQPDRDVSVSNILLRRTSDNGDDGGGGGDGGEPVSGPVGGAASIILSNLSATSINIAESGGVVNSTFTFTVQDSTGRALDLNNAVDVAFNIVEGPGGGEAITPEIARTNSNGAASASLFAGNVAGNVKIEAVVERDDIGLTIRSSPILLAIHGGFPDQNHFSIAARTFNFEGFSINGIRNQITVIVGDKFSNPVKPGTPVYFNTTGGIIQGSGQTNDDGETSVDLISGDPRPPTGYATVTAFTFDENNQEITKSIEVLFSGPPSNGNITVTPSTFDIPPNGSESFEMIITDINGNPLPAGTTIVVEPAEGMTVEGDVEVAVPNTLFPGPGVTEFTFTARDTDDESDAVQAVSIVITVTTPQDYTARKTLQGTKAKNW